MTKEEQIIDRLKYSVRKLEREILIAQSKKEIIETEIWEIEKIILANDKNNSQSK